jgi:phosphatidylglycerol:prolipoprotein diacylglycerol transferase
MRPVLIQIGDFALPSYGLMLVISFISAILFVRHAAKKFKISPLVIENLAFYLMCGVIIGGRLLYVIFHWHQYESDILGIVRIWEGGMMFYGGFIGGLLASILYLHKEHVSVLLLGDVIAPAIGLGTFFTRIGCFLNGCCFGIPSSLPWAIRFPRNCVAGCSPVADYALHPTQLYSSLFGLALFFFLWKRLYSVHKQGEVFALYLILSGGFRFGIDFIRYYEDNANFLINQIIALALVVIGVIILVKARKSTKSVVHTK